MRMRRREQHTFRRFRIEPQYPQSGRGKPQAAAPVLEDGITLILLYNIIGLIEGGTHKIIVPLVVVLQPLDGTHP